MRPNGYVYPRTLESGVGSNAAMGQSGWLLGRRVEDEMDKSRDILEPSLSLVISNPKR